MGVEKNIAVIGCGYWGKNLVRNFSELGVLAAVCDSNMTRAIFLAKKYNTNISTWVDVLQNPQITAVVIATPAQTHTELVCKALKAKKDVFVEKPLALDVASTKKISILAQNNQRILMVGHLLQYHPAFLKLTQIIKTGVLGDLQYIYSNRLSLGKVRNEEDVLWSFAPHDISVILALANSQPTIVEANAGFYLNDGVADVATIYLRFNNAIKAHIFVSWIHPYKEKKMVIQGSKATCVFDDEKPWSEKLILYRKAVKRIDNVVIFDESKAEKIPLIEVEPLRLECQHFLDCIKQRKEPKTGIQDGMSVLQVLHQASVSLKRSTHKSSVELCSANYFIHPSSYVEKGVKINKGVKIWHFSHILKDCEIGSDTTIGQNVMIGPEVSIGKNCKIQNNVSLYKGVVLKDSVFCGPSVVFTNVKNPRAEIDRKNEFLMTNVECGVTIGANATIVCGIYLGAYCFIGAGSVVTKDVKPHALMMGNPAKQVGWVSHAGEKLGSDLLCPREGRRYFLNESLELGELVEGVQTALV